MWSRKLFGPAEATVLLRLSVGWFYSKEAKILIIQRTTRSSYPRTDSAQLCRRLSCRDELGSKQV